MIQKMHETGISYESGANPDRSNLHTHRIGVLR